MSVRDPGYRPRRTRRSGRVVPALAAAAVVLALAIPFGSGLLGGGSGPAGSGSPSAAPSDVAQASPSAAGGGTASPGVASPGSSAGASPTPGPSATPVVADVAIVPVTDFRSTATTAGWNDLDALARGNGTFDALVLVDADADAILGALRTDRAALGSRLTTVASADELAADLAAHRGRLGFLRAADVGPGVRALAWGDAALYGVDRVRAIGDWPLTAALPVVPGTAGYDPGSAWTLVAGGDILLDRGVSLAIRGSKRGADFPFDGGTVTITGRCKDCSPMGWDLPYTRRTGDAGVVRDLVSAADIAIANFENPAPDRFTWHSKGTVFSANPAHIAGLAKVGIDWVSLANNHMGDAGRNGILQTMANLDEAGIAHGGAGNDRVEARTPTILEAGGVKVAFLGYDAIAPVYHAKPGKIGTAGLSRIAVEADVKKAREMGADVVIVFPHWGVEYRATPSQSQRDIAHAAIDAGADMIIGNHAHWAAAVETYKGRPIWYALGNFVFDQTWSEPTMEGVTLELTFDGPRLAQVRMRPHLILDRGQPNFMDPAKAGKVVMDQVFRASKGLLDW